MPAEVKVPAAGDKVVVMPCGLDGGPVTVVVKRGYLDKETNQPIIFAHDSTRGVDLSFIRDAAYGWITMIDYEGSLRAHI
jgi:hypothetical protein